jgi:hypothetical protein
MSGWESFHSQDAVAGAKRGKEEDG